MFISEENILKIKHFLEIRILLVPKVIYFFLNIAYYFGYPFIAVYANDVFGIGKYHYMMYVATFRALSHFIGASFWTYLADVTKKHKLILVLTTLLYGGSMCLYLVDGPFSYDGVSANKTSTIAWFSFVTALCTWFSSAMFPIVDNQIVTHLSQDPRFTKDLFGRQRLWGTIGHAIATILTGASVEAKGYTTMVISCAAMCIAFVFFVEFFLSNYFVQNNLVATSQKDLSKAGKEDTEKSQSLLQKMKSSPYLTLISNKNFAFFLFVIFITGLAKHILSSLSAPIVKSRFDNFKNDSLMLGLSQATHVVPEVLIFFFGKWMNRKVGVYWMLMFAQLATVFRFFALALLPPGSHPIFILMVESVKGISNGCMVSAAVRISYDMAPKGFEAAAQGAYSGVYQGFSDVLSGIIGALLIGEHGDYLNMMFVVASASLGALFLLFLKWCIIDRVIGIPCLPERKKEQAAVVEEVKVKVNAENLENA